MNEPRISLLNAEYNALCRRLKAAEEVVRAAQEYHRVSGLCPICGAGPPPYHSDGCAVAAFEEGT